MSDRLSPAQFVALIGHRRSQFINKEWARRGAYQRRNPIASDLGDCARQMVLSIIGWNVRGKPSEERMEAMGSGRDQELATIEALAHEGWEVIQQQEPFELRDRNGRVILTGKKDLTLLDPETRTKAPVELKDTSFPNFNRYETVDDLNADLFGRRWVRQLRSYLLAFNAEWGVIMLTHRKRRKPIVVEQDYVEAERILGACEKTMDVAQAMRATRDETWDEGLTDRGLAYSEDPRACRFCDFHLRVCFPPSSAPELGEIQSRPDLADIIERHEQLREAHGEYDALHRKLDKEIPKGGHVAAGEWLVTGRWETQKTKGQPAQPAIPAGTREVWKRTYKRFEETTR